MAEGSGLTIFNLWGIAWRTTVTVVVFGIVAYLSMGYGFTKRDQLAIAQIQQAYQAGAMDALLQCPKVQRQRTKFATPIYSGHASPRRGSNGPY